MTLRDKIRLGMAVLENANPDWFWRVNVNELRMDYERQCALGQLYGGFTRGRKILNLTKEETYDLGFLSWWQRKSEMNWLPFVGWRLTKAWKEAIIARRKAAEFEYELEKVTMANELEACVE